MPLAVYAFLIFRMRGTVGGIPFALATSYLTWRFARVGVRPILVLASCLLGTFLSVRASEAFRQFITPDFVLDAAKHAVEITRAPRAPETLPVRTGAVASPVTVHDVMALRAAVYAGQWESAEATLEGYAAAARADVGQEGRWSTIYSATFGVPEDSMLAAIRRWRAARPQRAEPSLALATADYARAWAYRGHDYAGQTAQASIYWFEVTLYDGADAIARALSRDPHLLPAYWLLMGTARSEGDPVAMDSLFARARILSPTSAITHREYLLSLLPRWGGSFRQMADFIDQARSLDSLDPDLGRLGGYIAWDAARMMSKDSLAERVVLLHDALSDGADPRFYETLGEAYFLASHFTAAAAAYDSALALEPTNVDARSGRASVLVRLAAADSGDGALIRARVLADSLIWVHLATGIPRPDDATLTE